MNIQISLVVVGFIALCVAGLFLIIKSFYLPKSFYKNKVEREKLLKAKIVSVMQMDKDETPESSNNEDFSEEELSQTG